MPSFLCDLEASLQNTYPPQNANFDPEIVDLVRQFVPSVPEFSINVYPYFALVYSGNNALADPALGRGPNPSILSNVIDAVRAALNKIGAPGSLPIIVGETGWPTTGGSYASVDNAQQYTSTAVTFARTSGKVKDLYLFEAFDESWKGPAETEKHFGLFVNTGTEKFSFDVDTDSAHPCSVWGWRYYDYVDLFGGDLTTKPASNRNDCQPLCGQTPGCIGYAFAWNTCYLKSTIGSIVPNGNVYSAVLC